MNPLVKNHENLQSNLALQNEKNILKRLDHENIVKYFEDDKLHHSSDFLVLEYIEKDLSSILRNPNIQINESKRKSVMGKLLDAVNYMHNLHILHRDLKPSNVSFYFSFINFIFDFLFFLKTHRSYAMKISQQ